jgi:hypothetical protein
MAASCRAHSGARGAQTRWHSAPVAPVVRVARPAQQVRRERAARRVAIVPARWRCPAQPAGLTRARAAAEAASLPGAEGVRPASQPAEDRGRLPDGEHMCAAARPCGSCRRQPLAPAPAPARSRLFHCRPRCQTPWRATSSCCSTPTSWRRCPPRTTCQRTRSRAASARCAPGGSGSTAAGRAAPRLTRRHALCVRRRHREPCRRPAQVWVKPQLQEDGKVYWRADSDSQLTKAGALLARAALPECAAPLTLTPPAAPPRAWRPSERPRPAAAPAHARSPAPSPPAGPGGAAGQRPQRLHARGDPAR